MFYHLAIHVEYPYRESRRSRGIVRARAGYGAGLGNYDEETSEGGADLIYGKSERILDDAAKTDGLTKKQFSDWGGIERVETRTEEDERVYQREKRREER